MTPRSSGLAGREQITRIRPDWAAPGRPAHRKSLPLITREALAEPGTPATHDRLVGRGKAKKLALVAAARKLLTWAWAVYRQQQPFDRARFAAPA